LEVTPSHLPVGSEENFKNHHTRQPEWQQRFSRENYVQYNEGEVVTSRLHLQHLNMSYVQHTQFSFGANIYNYESFEAYEACPESKDTNVLNMYNIFNLLKRQC